MFILSFVYKTLFIEKYEHHLVSEDYYKEELHYQEEIDKLNNANLLLENVVLMNENNGIKIIFIGNRFSSPKPSPKERAFLFFYCKMTTYWLQKLF